MSFSGWGEKLSDLIVVQKVPKDSYKKNASSQNKGLRKRIPRISEWPGGGQRDYFFASS